jgi:sugar O-acyltransferase (sialic acid O-acetyltransferase NeuD family)
MNKLEIILVGAGGHAHACIDVIEQQDRYQIAGLVGKQDEINTEHIGYYVIASDNNLAKLVKVYKYAFIAVGQILSPDKRIYLYQQAINLGFRLPTIISPSAYVSRHASVGAGSIVMHGAIVNAGAKVGENCIINTRSLIEHDAIVEDHCHISSGAILNGDVKISTGCFVGSGCIVKEGVSLGENCVVGMGTSVRHNLADHSRFVGNNKT